MKKDILTSLQVAFFYEFGSTADLQQEVGKSLRDSYGVGLRMITASGVVFRADIAMGRMAWQRKFSSAIRGRFYKLEAGLLSRFLVVPVHPKASRHSNLPAWARDIRYEQGIEN